MTLEFTLKWSQLLLVEVGLLVIFVVSAYIVGRDFTPRRDRWFSRFLFSAVVTIGAMILTFALCERHEWKPEAWQRLRAEANEELEGPALELFTKLADAECNHRKRITLNAFIAECRQNNHKITIDEFRFLRGRVR